jgi:hypothetical protein
VIQRDRVVGQGVRLAVVQHLQVMLDGAQEDVAGGERLLILASEQAACGEARQDVQGVPAVQVAAGAAPWIICKDWTTNSASRMEPSPSLTSPHARPS